MPDDVGVTGGAEGSRGFPPSEPPMEELALHEPPGWPKVVGIISICWAGIGLLCGVCGLGSLMFMTQMMKPAEQQFGPMPDVAKPETAQLIVGAIGMISPVLLLIAGISTVSRKPIGRSLHLVYAASALVLGGAGLLLAAQHQLKLEAWAKANSADKWAPQLASPFAWVGIAFGAALTLAWPVFCVCWFGLAKKRPEVGYSELQVV